MAYTEGVLPSDGNPIRVKILPLYALEDIPPEIPPDFSYVVKGGDGGTYEVTFPLEERLAINPQPPGPEAGEWERIEWDRLQAALRRREQQAEARRQRSINCARRIIGELDPADQERIVNEDDYDAIYRLALAPEVSKEDIARELRAFFQG